MWWAIVIPPLAFLAYKVQSIICSSSTLLFLGHPHNAFPALRGHRDVPVRCCSWVRCSSFQAMSSWQSLLSGSIRYPSWYIDQNYSVHRTGSHIKFISLDDIIIDITLRRESSVSSWRAAYQRQSTPFQVIRFEMDPCVYSIIIFVSRFTMDWHWLKSAWWIITSQEWGRYYKKVTWVQLNT